MEDKCSKSHTITWECWKKSIPCPKCEAEVRKLEKQRIRNHNLDVKRQEKEREYTRKLAEIDAEIAHEKRLQREGRDQIDRENTLRQRQEDLKRAREATTRETTSPSTDSIKVPQQTGSKTTNSTSSKTQNPSIPANSKSKTNESNTSKMVSKAKDEWEYQKRCEGAADKHLDTLMDMIGLESIKAQILTIKTKIDTCVRQGTNLNEERFGVALLGNPGTGMMIASPLRFDADKDQAKRRSREYMPSS